MARVLDEAKNALITEFLDRKCRPRVQKTESGWECYVDHDLVAFLHGSKREKMQGTLLEWWGAGVCAAR